MNLSRFYPEKYDEWWVDTAMKENGIDDMYELVALMEKNVSMLSDALTLKRSAGFDYHGSRPGWLAYGLFYFPQNYIRMSFILDEISARIGKPFFSKEVLRIMDIGSGPGSASFALIDWLGRNRFKGKVELTCLDQSELALEYSRRLMDSVKAGQKAIDVSYVQRSMCDSGAIDGKWDMVVSSYALNEVFQEADETFSGWLKSVLDSVSDGGLLAFCEPIEYDKFNRINAIRDAVLGVEGFRIIAPCLHMKRCPMISLNGGWCHDVRRWHPPESLRLLNRKLFRQIEHLKYSFIAAGRVGKGAVYDVSSARMIAPIKDEKGRSLMKGCAGDGSMRLYEVQDRALTKDQLEGLDALERGDLVEYQIEKELRNGEVLRVKSLESLL